MNVFTPIERLLTAIKTSHEGNFAVDGTQLLVMGPEEDHVVTGTIQGLDGIVRDLIQAETSELQVGEAALDLRRDIHARGVVVGVSEDLDVGVKSLEHGLGVL